MSGDNLPNIIAVDDDYAVRMAMDFMFKKWPEYNLILAEDSKDALSKLEEHEYMMMFCDINMPEEQMHQTEGRGANPRHEPEARTRGTNPRP